MTRLKLATLCFLLALAALLLAGLPQQASAKGICGQIKNQISDAKKQKRFPAKRCVDATDVRKNNLTHEDMRNEAGFNFVKGAFFDRKTPTDFTTFATLDIVPPGFGQVIVTAYVSMGTLVPQRMGGSLECHITITRLDGEAVDAPGRSNTLSVIRGKKRVDEMFWSETFQLSGGLSRFKLECKSGATEVTDFEASSYMTAEYYPRTY